MFNFLLVLLPVAITLIISSGLVKLFGYKIEHANFFTVCSTTLLLILFGIIGILNIGLILIYICAFVTLIYLLVKKFNFISIFTPAISFLVLNLLVFAFLVRDISLYTHDEVSHWALATKSMYYSGEFYKGLQGMFTSTFNYFFTKTSYYASGQLYIGAWLLIWSCFILPMGSIKWQNWKRALVYLFAAYCLTGYIFKDVTLHIDELMAFMSAAIIVYWALLSEKNLKEYMLLALGILAISQIKESFGALCALFVAFFAIVNEFVVRPKNIKISLVRLGVIAILPFVGFWISIYTIEKPFGYYNTSQASSLPVVDLLLHSKSFICIGVLFAISLIAFIFFYFNRKQILFRILYHKIFGVASIFFLVILSYKFTMLFISSLNLNDIVSYTQAWRSFFVSTSGGVTNIYTTALLVTLFGFAGAFAIKSSLLKINLTRLAALLFNIIVMGLAVLIAYSTGFDETGMYTNSVSWERYTCIPFIILMAYSIGYYILSNEIYLSRDKKIIISFICLFIVLRYLPYPTTIAFARYSRERVVFQGVASAVKEDEDIIENYLDYNDSVFVISAYYEKNVNECGDGRTKWLKYQISPIKSNWNYNEDYDDYIFSTGSVENHILNISRYDYLYIQSAGPQYYDIFGEIYPDEKFYHSNALYKIRYIENELILVPIYLDGTKLLD